VPWPRIHCGSVVMVSPGTRIRLSLLLLRWWREEEEEGRVESLARLGVRESVSLEESVWDEGGDEGERDWRSSSESEGGRMIMAMFVARLNIVVYSW
jgi:hypothetical protein